MSQGLICDNCGAAMKAAACDGWLVISRLDIPTSSPGPMSYLAAVLHQVEVTPEGLKMAEPPAPTLRDDPLRAANVQFCTTSCALTYLEQRQSWESAIVAERVEP